MSRNRFLKPLALFTALALGAGYLSGARAAEATPPAADAPSSGVYYEIFVRAWYDTNGDGIGDLNGVTAKLDYLKSLGISGIWLMPINNSPSYHGYDITDYYGINPQYGTVADLQHLVDEAHKRGIAVTMDMVINHSSNEHPWFVAAQKESSARRNWYTWTMKRPNLDAMSATDTPIWHAGDDGWYLGVFGGHMPDLNYDNPDVRAEMIKVGQFWLRKGVDGFRLDAAKHIYVNFKADEHSQQALDKNVAWWTEYREGLQKVNPNVTLVGEVSAESPKQLAPYLKPLGSIFDFPLAEQLIVSAKSENVGKLDALLKATYDAYKLAGGGGPSCASCARGTRPSTASAFIDSTFLSNHDQERVMSRLDGNLDHMRVAAAMLLTLPGRPYIYYGEELGMEGKKPDPNLREPMRWTREAGPGESRWKPTSVNQGQAVSVQSEQDDPHSLYNTYRTLIGWRAQNSALRDGKLDMQATGNPHLFAYWRDDGKQRVLVVHNLSGKDAMWKPKAGVLPKETTVLLTTESKASLQAGRLNVPAYGSVVLH
ncbi:MAG TPA: alpha-amylase family glycosyl hydrolase [Dyella sp.]|uniref:alpha-amylase family glycosyl hydrolase n=1 Tax=Dyella sp. TaxID=1869338 RepID=UPI002D77F786|nr:alpha-amylase family glycosyl hydrolase [Dyella sp.]HET6552421.1 alpha-amylase family glycosyl hydrolase [Dyella sp.]